MGYITSVPQEKHIRGYQMNATEKQVSYALFLLNRKGYSTRHMDSRFKDLGASMRERSGKVSDWLAGMNRQEISNLIQKLQ